MKTKPYGVRFNADDLFLLESELGISSPQRAVNFLFQYWREHRDVLVDGSVVAENPLPSANEVMLEKLRKAVVAKVDINSRDIGLSKFQLEMRKKKFGF